MKYSFACLLFLTSVLPLSSIAQLGAADPVTGNAPINFYGRVVDQDNNPISGVKVDLKILVGYLASPTELGTRYDKTTLATASNGGFIFMGASGHSLEIESMEKEGYKLSKKADRFYPYSWSAGIFHPDAKNPVVFRMWKKGSAEPLVVGSKFYGIVPDGEPCTIDFVQQKKKSGISTPGDIIVRIKRPDKVQPRTKYDWSCSIEAVDGGLIHSDDEFMLRAPETGYQPKYQFIMSATNTEWHSQIKDQQFYFKSRDGQVYGSFMVEIIPRYNNKSVFNVQYAVNPAGSRNLER